MVKEPIYHRSLHGQPDQAYDAIQKSLLRLGFKVLGLNAPAKTITVQATVKLLDWVLWSCYGDKVVFQCTPRGENETDVNVYGIPNLLRVGIRKGEKVFDMTEMTRAFESLLEAAANDMMQPIAQKTGSG